ncbi:MAG TPA: autotransporter-associated beta strand repeat-containing protein [Luteolibacter sp.]|nr:autotransporter-associated beta strand repeat-containing protein [Luteolibacter sp.]
MKPCQNPFLRAAMAGASFFALTLGASAQIYWDGTLSGTNALWSNVTGWSIDSSLDAPDPTAAPAENDIASFSGTNVLTAQAILLNGAQSAAGLSFPTTTFNHTFSSNDTTARTLSIGGSGIDMPNADSAGGNVTFNNTNAVNIAVTAPQTWNVGANRNLSINSVLSGSPLFTKTGTGTLTLNGTNTFANFTHSAGLLSLNNTAALGSTSGTFTIAGGTIQNASTTAPLVIGNAKPITLAGNFGYIIPTNGNGNLNLGTGPVTLAPISGTSITVDNGSGVIAFDGPVSGTGFGIVKTGAGTLALMGNNTYTGLTDLRQSANLRVNGMGGIATTNVFLNGGLLELGGTVVENNALTLGTAPGQVRFKTDAPAHGGFGSASGYRKISLTSEGVPNAPLVWGVTPHFMPATLWSISSTGIFLLNTPFSAGTIDFTNNLDFGGLDRRFSVRDGSAPNMPDAVLSGLLTNGQLSLQTSGTLFVSNPANTISGNTYVTGGGALRVPQIAGYLGTSKVTLDGAMLEVGADASVSLGSGPGQVAFTANGGGFSSYGGTRSVSIGGTSAPITWGSTGFLDLGGNLLLGGSGSDGLTRFTNPIDLGTSLRNVVVQNGGGYTDASLDGVLSGAGGGIHLSSGNGALQLANSANTYTGATQISSGAIVLDTLANGGIPSSLGASSNATANLLFTGGSIRYIGSTASTDRLFELRASATINSAGFGPITFSNTAANAFTSNSGSATTRTFSLSGISPGVNVLNSGISNSTLAANNTTALNKLGTTTWSIGGNNLFTGNTTITAGELILDYSGTNNPMGGTSPVIIDNSNLTLKGKASGVTAAAISGFRFGNGANGITNVLTLDAPAGSSGIALTLGSLGGSTTTTNALTSNLIDLSSNAGNTVIVAAVNNGFSAVGNVIFANATGSPANGRSNLVVRDSTGYGFAALTGTLPTATLTRLNNTTTTALTAANTGNANHYRLSYAEMTPDSGDVPNGRKLTRTSALIYSTLAIEATGGPVHLDLAAQALGDSNSNNGRGILISGDQDVKFTGTGTTAYSPYFYHYGTGKFEFNLAVPNGFSVIAGGSGLYDYTGATTGADARFYISGPVFRFSSANNFAALTGGGFWVGNDGIIEIANDLNGTAPGDFSNAIGNNNGNIRLTGDSGFSASGGHRVANFGGAGAQLVWGTNYFVTSGGNNDSDLSLRLSSPKSDSTIEIVNPIALGGRDRVIDVANGSAATDAILSGEISGLTAGIYKRGLGTLVLDGTNTYTGITNVEAGVLRLTKASLANNSTVRIASGAKLDLAHGQTDTVAALVVNGTPVAPNIYGAADLPLYLSGSGKLNVGGVPGGTTPYDDWVTANNLPSDKDLPEEDADDDGLRNILEYSVGSHPFQPSGSVLSKAPGNTGAVQFSRAPGRTDITTVVETSPDLALNSWTIVATSTAGAAFVSNDANVTVTDSNNPSANSAVSVTDNRSPIPAKRFYRLRVTK